MQISHGFGRIALYGGSVAETNRHELMWFFDSPPQTLHIRQFYQKNLLNHLHGIIIIIKLTYWGFYFYFLSH